MPSLFERVLSARGLTDKAKRASFLRPDYANNRHDPFLLPDMAAAVERLVAAHAAGEQITIYGDYDIDGLTATTLLLDALASFGFERVEAFIPNRFVEGYGMTVEAVESIAAAGAQLIITVDCGSLSHEPITRARELGVDVIVTDHHNVAFEQPPAVAVINPKRLLKDYPDRYDGFILKKPRPTPEDLYPFLDLPGVGVAFKLVQALQSRLDGLPEGQEKWLLDLVALGTVCDVVRLEDENRLHVYWGLQVLAKTRRPGLRALMAVAGVEPSNVDARSLGFALGPRMNAAGRLETAQLALDMLTARDGQAALEKAYVLDEMNARRRKDQDAILKDALILAEQFADDPVLVVSAPGWNHGIVGIVAAKLLERFQKPTFVLQEYAEAAAPASQGQAAKAHGASEAVAKGSARSYGNFSAAEAIRASSDIITKGGGHALAAGVTVPVREIAAFRARVNQYYREQGLSLEKERAFLLPQEDAVASLGEVTEEVVAQLATLEPFGNGNPAPIIRSDQLDVRHVRRVGSEGQHLKLTLIDAGSVPVTEMEFVAFSAPEAFFVDVGDTVRVWYQTDINEWRGRRSVQGKLLRLERLEDSIR
ncbi:single-stranded DNA exonuclease RecJ [Candidatus Saccharibacteria bacterium]|nr:MAG: single-stranded DNA exonuclease RecJ [Candidatus Saccharibacteria bacterium]